MQDLENLEQDLGESEEMDYDAQESLQNQDAERTFADESPAQILDNPQRPASTQSEKVGILENKKILRKLEKIDEEINDGMGSCNTIIQTITPILKDGLYIRENMEKERARRGDASLIYLLANIVSKMESTFNASTGDLKNIRSALRRIQESVDDIKEEVTPDLKNIQ